MLHTVLSLHATRSLPPEALVRKVETLAGLPENYFTSPQSRWTGSKRPKKVFDGIDVSTVRYACTLILSERYPHLPQRALAKLVGCENHTSAAKGLRKAKAFQEHGDVQFMTCYRQLVANL